MLSTSPCTPGLTPPAQDPTTVLGLRPGRGRGRSSRLAGWTPVGVPRHEGPRGAGAHGPWGSLPTPQSGAAEVERPLPPGNPPPTLRAPDPAPPWRLRPPCPDPVCLVLPERLVSRISPFPPLPGPPGPSLSARGPRGGRLDTTSPPSFDSIPSVELNMGLEHTTLRSSWVLNQMSHPGAPKIKSTFRRQKFTTTTSWGR
uniref:Uncharacterized protein n=1 Tax=Mustela putorius furo TaxID=9669 RepID=M3XX70_MUSPF